MDYARAFYRITEDISQEALEIHKNERERERLTHQFVNSHGNFV